MTATLEPTIFDVCALRDGFRIEWSLSTRSPSMYCQTEMRGDALHLYRLWAVGECPVGILLDRLEEYPEEAGNVAAYLVRAMVASLRQAYARSGRSLTGQ